MGALNIFTKRRVDFQKKQVRESPVQATLQAEEGTTLLRPHITEKANALSSHNHYVFVVGDRATKQEVAQEVEGRYGVSVEKVYIVQAHAKRKRLGRIQGMKKGYKKVIVKIEKGQKIEILPT